jgi:hypothetical protein
MSDYNPGALAKRRHRHGSNVVEFALLLPVLITILSGVVEVGWYQQQQAVVDAAVNRAARTGSRTDLGSNPVTEAQAMLVATLADDGKSLSDYIIDVRGKAPNRTIYVQAEVPYDNFLGLLPLPGLHRGSIGMRMEIQTH